MKKALSILIGILLLPAVVMGFEAGPRSQSNFGNNTKTDNTAAAAANSRTRSLSTYGEGRSWTRSVQTQGVQTQVAGQQPPRREKKEELEPAPGAFVDNTSSQLSGLKGRIEGKGKGGNKAAPAAQQVKQASTPEPKQEGEKTQAAAEQTQGGEMPAGVEAMMGQMQNMMGMLGAMGGAGGAGGAQPAASGAQPAAGGMPAGMPDISALMGSMGAMGGGGAPAKK